MVQIHETHAAFNQPTSQQTVAAKSRVGVAGVTSKPIVFRFRTIYSVGIEDRACFAGQIEQLGSRRLHAKRQSVRSDSIGDLRVARQSQPLLIQRANCRETLLLIGRRDARWGLQIQDGLSLVS